MRPFIRNVALACLLVLGLPRVALARSLDVTAVQIEATVKEDGSLAVVEQRTYDASGSYSGILWDVHEGVYEGRRVEAEVTRVEAILGGQRTLLSEEETGANGTYELTDLDDYQQLKIFWPTEDETVTFLVGYTVSGITSRWADTGELYWQYVPADPGSQGEWRNVTCTVELPVPDGAVVVPGDNVHAWGHGPIDGEVDFEGDAVRFFSPGVGADEFLEARIAFPAEWLDKQPAANEVRLDSILAEEDQWAKEANARRWMARAVVFGIPGAMVLMGLGSVAVTFWTRRREAGGIFPKAQFSDKYFRDVPTDDHPAVLGMLYRNGALGTADYTATIMRLANQGRVLHSGGRIPRRNGVFCCGKMRSTPLRAPNTETSMTGATSFLMLSPTQGGMRSLWIPVCTALTVNYTYCRPSLTRWRQSGRGCITTTTTFGRARWSRRFAIAALRCDGRTRAPCP